MATTPSFDPGLFDTGVSQAQWHALDQRRRAPLINKATVGVYAPGSTFKMAVALAALEAGVLTPTEQFFCPGYLDPRQRRGSTAGAAAATGCSTCTAR